MTAFVWKDGTIDPDDEYAIPTTVGDGFPVLAALIGATPYIPAQIWGPPENCYPAEGGDFEWDLFTLKGKPAPKFVWEKVTNQDRDRIDSELQTQCRRAHEAAMEP